MFYRRVCERTAGPGAILQLARRHARVDVLVTVKASPQPSSSYGDTVCVAGILMEDQPRWIRLYPVPFRYLDGPKQFDKYAPISVELHEATQDRRPESAKINVASIRVGKVIKPWQGRSPWVEPLVTSTMCDLVAGTRENLNATSLGAIRPADVDSDLTFKVHPPWSAAQAANLLAAESQGELFGQRGPALKPPRLKAILHLTPTRSSSLGTRRTWRAAPLSRSWACTTRSASRHRNLLCSRGSPRLGPVALSESLSRPDLGDRWSGPARSTARRRIRHRAARRRAGARPRRRRS